MEARSVLARSTLPLMRQPSIFVTLEELAASSTIQAAAQLFPRPHLQGSPIPLLLDAAPVVTASSPRSIGVIKRQVFQSYFQSLAEAWAVADKEMIASFGSEDFKEGVAHFVEKRTAMFSGR